MSIVDRITEVLTTPRLLGAGLEAPEISGLAERVAELLVDLAGTGQLLASIAAIGSDAGEAK